MAEQQPWLRRPEETPKAYEAFESYYMLPAQGRSIDAAWKHGAKVGQTRGKNRAPSTWEVWSSKHHWVERAAAWDAYQSAQRRQRFLDDAAQDKAERIRSLKAARGKLLQGLQHLDPEKATYRDVMNGLRVIFDQLRAEYDDVPGSSVEKPLHTVEWTVEQWQAQQEARRAMAANIMDAFERVENVDTED